MQDLRAQVTSSLLQFPEATIQAFGEDEITRDSMLHGKFSRGIYGLAWLACGPQLEVVNAVTGERLSTYRFSGVNEQYPTIRVVKEFSWQKRTGLLVGLEEAKGSVLCLYDLGTSRVVKAVVLPGRVTAIEPITNPGGASVSPQHLHQTLQWLFGVAAVATDVGDLLLVDLCLDDLSCSQKENEASGLIVVTRIPAEVPQSRETVTRKGRHLCFQLQSPSGTAISTLCYISGSNQLVVGFSDGYLSLWNMKTLKREHHSQLEGGRIPVYAVTFQEPENDPCNCCYLWAVQSTQDREGDVVSLHLLQLAFGDRKRLASGQVMYEGLEYCRERYSLDLTGGVFPLRGQTSKTKLLSCQTVEKICNHVDREESVDKVISPDTSVSIFSWQVNTHDQGKPSTYLGVFDINCWYHAQMPDSLRPEESLHDCPYFACWSLDTITSMTSPNLILDIVVHERSLSRRAPPSYPPAVQLFHPSTYNFVGMCLLNSGVVHMTCTSFQKEEEQLDAVLSAAVQTGSLGHLTECIKLWTSKEQPSSAANLRFVLDWTWNKVIYAKNEFDQICVPLFDGSCDSIEPRTAQSLQHCQLLLSNLSTVLNCFPTEAQELTEKGFADLTNKQVGTSLISLYARVVLWFCQSTLLPEGFVDDDKLLSRPFYNYPLTQSYYTGHRQKLEHLSRGKWDSDCLMIDGMVSQLGDRVEKLWQRDEGGTGKYPPPSLHALLDLYLLEGVEEIYKHAITIYLLLDIMHSSPRKTETSIDSFRTAFAIPWGLVKLIQGFWLLDHNDYENSLALLFHPSTIKMVSWLHVRILRSLMCQGEHRRALRYIQMMKPSFSSSSEVRLFLTVLLSNRCMAEARALLQQHTTNLNIEELLKHMYEMCQEMGLMEDFLKLPFTDSEQKCLEKFLQNHEILLVRHLQRANYNPALLLNQTMNVNLTNDRHPCWRQRAAAVARNAVLGQHGKILPRVQRQLAVGRAKPYHLPSSIPKEAARPKPFSTLTKQANAGNVHTIATFISHTLPKIREVRVGNEQKPSCSQYDRVTEPPVVTHPVPDAELRDAFVGTPLTKFAQICFRLWNLVVRLVPSCSAAQAGSWQSPCTASASFVTSSPLKSNTHGSNFSEASELNLLGTPRVVKEKVTDDDKALPGASSEHRQGVVEHVWSESRDKPTPFTLSNPEDDCAEMEESPESIPGLEKTDVSKENSNFSARSDQTTLEYRDAKSPDGFEDDVIFIAAKPAISSTEETADFQELEKKEDSELADEKPFQMEQPDSSEPRKEAAVISILDNEDVVSTHSKIGLEGKRVDLPKERNLEAAEVEENVAFPREEITVSNNLPKAEEINVIEDSAVKAQTSDLSKSSLPQTEFKLPVTPRRSARKGAQNLLANTDSASTQEDVHSGGKVEILDTPRRRTRRVPHAKPEKMDTHEQTPAQPNEESTPPRTTARTGRQGRKRRSISEESTGEETFHQGPGGSPLLLEDINPSRHDKRPRPWIDRIARTCPVCR